MSENYDIKFRFNIILAVLVFAFCALSVRLVELQLLSADEYGTKSKKNSVRKVVREPSRGTIFDRKKETLVDTRPVFALFITPSDLDTSSIKDISFRLQISDSLIIDKLEKGKKYSIFNPIKIKKEINERELAYFSENYERYPGVEIFPEPKRTYLSMSKMTHFLGYVKEITDDQIVKDTTNYYTPGDYVGQLGLESTYESILRGIKGYNYILVNSKGQRMGQYNNGEMDRIPMDGLDLNLSIDLKLQTLGESLLGEKMGAIVAMDPSNGEILAFVSKPDYDLSYFSGVTPPDVWQKLSNDPSKPLYNRVSQGEYPPGSTFKMVLATTALELGVIDENWTAHCNGSLDYGDKVFKCTHAHGNVNVTRAIHQSCNVFFYNLMLKLNRDKNWSDWLHFAKLFGFSQKTGIDIIERSGFLPSPEYYQKLYGRNFSTGLLLSLAIGQGEVNATPLQVACYCSAIANWGELFTPHFVHSYYNKHSKKETLLPLQSRQLGISKRVMGIIRNGMLLAVNVPGGTGLAARVPGVEVAGKTGTAQNPHGNNHAWFIGFAPYDKPKIAIAVLVENAGYGGTAAAPIAGALIKQYLLNKDKNLSNDEMIKDAQDILNSVTSGSIQN
jgi:penicillin-binding protein 2